MYQFQFKKKTRKKYLPRVIHRNQATRRLQFLDSCDGLKNRKAITLEYP